MASRYGKKFEIKSESWIDLSRIVDQSASSLIDEPAETNLSTETRLGASSASSSYDRNQQDNKKKRSESLRADQQQQQHLLIRLRQQSYLNRSSASLWSASSQLSNSIDLTTSLAGDFYDEPPAANDYWMTNNDLLKREPTRLRLLRNKFQRKSRKICRDVREASPSARSLSSSIGDRLSDIRHSWKHFLYKYASRKYPATSDQQHAGEENSNDRLLMTDQWIARYHQQLMEADPSR